MHLVGNGYSASLEHLVVKLLLLEICKLRLELIVVDGVCRRALSKSACDFFADGVLFFKILPVDSVSIFQTNRNACRMTYMVASTLSIVRPP